MIKINKIKQINIWCFIVAYVAFLSRDRLIIILNRPSEAFQTDGSICTETNARVMADILGEGSIFWPVLVFKKKAF